MENIVQAPDVNTMELELMVEDELSRLQRQYRIMESDRVAYLDHVKCNTDKQKNILSNLRNEQSQLRLNLGVADSKYNKRKDEQIIVLLRQLLEKHSALVEKIKARKTYVTEVDYQIRNVQSDIMAIKFQMRKIEFSRHERLATVQANLHILENKLETSNNRFGVILSQNKRLRQEIDYLLQERQLFNKNWQFIFMQLEASKKFMIDLIEQATLAYGHREEWCQKLDALKFRAMADLQYHSEEMRELQRILDHDVDLQNFLSVKGQRRVAKSLLKKELMKREEAKIRLKEQSDKYTKIFHDIQAFAEENGANNLANQFLKQEEENFALFNYIHELNSELESLSDAIAALQIKIVEQREKHNKRNVKQIENINYMHSFLRSSTVAGDIKQNKCVALNKQLYEIFMGIGRLFQKINCDNAPILELLGQVMAPGRGVSGVAKYSMLNLTIDIDSVEVPVGKEGHSVMNVHNVRLYLGVLETNINDCIRNILCSQGRKKEDLAIDPTMGNCSKKCINMETIGSPCPLCYETVLMARTDIVCPVMSYKDIKRTLMNYDTSDPKMIHHVSQCDMPHVTETMKKRLEK